MAALNDWPIINVLVKQKFHGEKYNIPLFYYVLYMIGQKLIEVGCSVDLLFEDIVMK